MADKTTASQLESGDEKSESSGGGNFNRYMILFVGGFIGLILVIFLIGLGLAVFADPGPTAERIRLLRDIFFIVMSLQGIVIIIALAALVVQVARLVNLLNNEIKPILDNAREATDTARGTAQFVGSNVTEPLVQTRSFLAGLRVFLREAGGIRRAIRPSRNGAIKGLSENEE